LGGVVFGLAAVWLALRAIAAPAVAPASGLRPTAPSAPEAEPIASPGERRA